MSWVRSAAIVAYHILTIFLFVIIWFDHISTFELGRDLKTLSPRRSSKVGRRLKQCFFSQLVQVVCGGWESNVGDCGHKGWGEHDCSQRESIGVRCYTQSKFPSLRDYICLSWVIAQSKLELMTSLVLGELEPIKTSWWIFHFDLEETGPDMIYLNSPPANIKPVK